MIELHIKLYRRSSSYWVDIIQPNNGNQSIPPPVGFPLKLIGGIAMLRKLQEDLLNLKPQDQTTNIDDLSNNLEYFLFGAQHARNALYDVWRKCYIDSSNQGGMRTVLHFESTPDGKAGAELAFAPWELIRFDNNKYLALWPDPLAQPQWPDQPAHLLVRSGWEPALPVVPVPLLPEDPLRVLLILGSDDQGINVIDEWQGIDSALFDMLPWYVDMHTLRLPTRNEIGEWCKQWRPHIVHFIGHGRFVKDGSGGSGQAKLLLKQLGANVVDELSPSDFSQLFPTYPQLVILNACRSGQGHSGRSSDNAYAMRGFAEHLINSGVPSVIAMQADILGAAAARLMKTFYQKLVACEPIDLALTHARNAVKTAADDRWTWALPMLYIARNHRIEDILALGPRNPQPILNVFRKIKGKSDYDRPKGISLQDSVRFRFGYDKAMREFERWFLLGNTPLDTPRLVLLTGESGAGKSNLIYWLSERCHRRGQRFLYADYTDFSQSSAATNKLTYLSILRMIRDGCPLGEKCGVPLDTDLNPNLAFNRFNDMLNSKIVPGYVRQEPFDPTSEIVDQAPDRELDAIEDCGSSGVGDPIAQITDVFWQDLNRAAGNRSLIVFLDHIPVTMPPREISLLQTHLLNRVVSTVASPIRVVLCRSTDDIDQPSWNFLKTEPAYKGPQVEEVNLPGFMTDEMVELAKIWARRFFLRWGGPPTILQWQRMYPKLIKLQNDKLNPFAAEQEIDEQINRVVDSLKLYGPMQLPCDVVARCIEDRALKDWAQRLSQK